MQPQEQRLTFRLLSYWNRIKADRTYPSLAEMKVSEMAELWHHMFSIRIGICEHEHSFSYFGAELVAIFGTNFTSDNVQDALQQNTRLEHTIGYYPKVIKTGAPQSDSDSFHLEGCEVRYRSLIVPLSSDGKTIDYLLGTTNYKIF